MTNEKKALELAELLYDMEAEIISNYPEFHWDFYEWTDKFGESSLKFNGHPLFTYTEDDVNELAVVLFNQYKENKIDTLEYDTNYPEWYSNNIVDTFERALANLTKVGTQLQILNLN